MGLKLLQAQGCNFKIIDYIKNPIGADTLKTILKALDIPAIDLVRTQESIWKSEFKGRALSENKIINALVKHLKLIKRPIVTNGQNPLWAGLQNMSLRYYKKIRTNLFGCGIVKKLFLGLGLFGSKLFSEGFNGCAKNPIWNRKSQ